MFKPSDDEMRLINRKRSLPKPGRVHGAGGKRRGKPTDKWTDNRPSVNKVNPAIRGQTNVVSGKFIDINRESDRYLDCPVRPIGQHQGNNRRQPTNNNGRALARR
jgi:hypothetical protein